MLQVTCGELVKMESELHEELANLGITGSNVVPSSNAEDYGNDQALERLWAIKAMKYAETHMKLLSARDARELRLTKYDDQMYEQFMIDFKDLKVNVIDVQEIKSEASKSKWREFCKAYENSITDYNFATLVRIDSSKDYSDENTFIVPRIQFLGIEVVRNRAGLNSSFYHSP